MVIIYVAYHKRRYFSCKCLFYCLTARFSEWANRYIILCGSWDFEWNEVPNYVCVL